MRWNRRYGLKDRLGEQRVWRRFLWWPRQFGAGATRWLEWADVVEEVVEMDVGGSGQWGEYAYEWRAVGFADEVEIVPSVGGSAAWIPKREG